LKSVDKNNTLQGLSAKALGIKVLKFGNW